MIQRSRQHLIRAFRVNRGLCHFPLSFCLAEPEPTPLASPSSPPSTIFPSSCRRERETHTQIGRDRNKVRQRETQIEAQEKTDGEKDRNRDRHRERNRDTMKETKTETKNLKKERKTERNREVERQK